MATPDITMNDIHETQHHQQTTIEDILSVWPTLHSLATSLSSGDLISLSRTSRTIRSITHAFAPSPSPIPPLNLGHHQTPHWAALKSAAPFTCISPTHKDPKSVSSSSDHSRKSQHPIRPCNFCNRPICRTCIVRSFFADPTQSRNTFRHRTRHLCTSCWDTGNLRKDYRHPLHASTSSREHIWHGQNYALRGQRCTCSASEDNWLCQPCRVLQNETGPLNVSFLEISNARAAKDGAANWTPINVPCYGLNCGNIIPSTDTSRDRRRICLWCSRPLARPFGGEDRLRWEEKQLTIRAAHAASRSADIAEWARNRFRSLTVSRREFRGVGFAEADADGEARFVRHLDAVNYRALVGEYGAPTPEDVYNSKHGYWRYKPAFLGHRAFWKRYESHVVGQGWILTDREAEPPVGVAGDELFGVTSEGALSFARRNKDIQAHLGGVTGGIHLPWRETRKHAVLRLAVQFYNAGLMTEEQLKVIDSGRYRFKKVEDWEDVLNRLHDQLLMFEGQGEGEVAARDMKETFGDLLNEKFGVTMRDTPRCGRKEDGIGTIPLERKADEPADSQPGPSRIPDAIEDQTEAAREAPPLDPPLEDESWSPPIPAGSPPPFTPTATSNTSHSD